jgi:hypothetical protein
MADWTDDHLLDVESWSVTKLKEELKRHNLKVGGTKNAQIGRLRSEFARQKAEHNFATSFSSTK